MLKGGGIMKDALLLLCNRSILVLIFFPDILNVQLRINCRDSAQCSNNEAGGTDEGAA